MSSTNIKEVVKEKYGEAASRVTTAAAVRAVGPEAATAAATRLRPTFTMPYKRNRFPKKRFWHRWAVATLRRWRN